MSVTHDHVGRPVPVQSSPTPTPEPTECDRCGAKGKMRVVLWTGLDLVFCAHHARDAADGLEGKVGHTELL